MADAAAGDADAYEAMRQAAMEAKATMLAELGMGETKSNLEQRARAAKRPRASSAKARGSSARAAALAEPTRRSRRVAGREAEAAAGLPKEVRAPGMSASRERTSAGASGARPVSHARHPPRDRLRCGRAPGGSPRRCRRGEMAGCQATDVLRTMARMLVETAGERR